MCSLRWVLAVGWVSCGCRACWSKHAIRSALSSSTTLLLQVESRLKAHGVLVPTDSAVTETTTIVTKTQRESGTMLTTTTTTQHQVTIEDAHPDHVLLESESTAAAAAAAVAEATHLPTTATATSVVATPTGSPFITVCPTLKDGVKYVQWSRMLSCRLD